MTHPPLTQTTLTRVESIDDAEELLRWLDQPRRFLGVDTETSGLDWWSGRLRTVQFGDPSRGWCIPEEWLGVAREVFRRYDRPMVAHNAKFDLIWLERDKFPVRRELIHDTQIMAHLRDNLRNTALKGLADEYVDPTSSILQEELKRAMKEGGWDWATVPTDLRPFWLYAALDPVITSRLAEMWHDDIAGELYETEMAVSFILADAEVRGVRIDVRYCEEQYDKLTREVESIDEEIRRRWPRVTNPGSGQMVADQLSRDGIIFREFTRTGRPKMSEDALRPFATHPLVPLYLRRAHAQKIAETYFASFLELEHRGRIHANVRQLAARTGRMSVTRPALQTLERSALVRSAVIPSEDSLLVSADYDAIEMRIFAHYAGEERMIRTIAEGRDIHSEMTRFVFGIGEDEEVPRDKRTIVKNGSFARVYGAGPAKFAQTVGLTVQEAEAFFARYSETFPGVDRFVSTVVRAAQQRALEDGRPWVRTAYGRRLYGPADEAYKLVNYLIQGTAADILKFALVDLDRAGLLDGFVLPVHDEFLFDVPAETAHEHLAAVTEVAAVTERFSVPLTLSGEVLKHWGEKYE